MSEKKRRPGRYPDEFRERAVSDGAGSSARAVRDVELVVEVHRVFGENLFVYGADKIWTQLNREEIRVARCTVRAFDARRRPVRSTAGQGVHDHHPHTMTGYTARTIWLPQVLSAGT